MFSNSNNNNINNYKISNDWGWYVDTENNSHIDPYINIVRKKIVNNLSSIEEEYNYHQPNYKDIECLYDIINYKELEEKSVSEKELICKIGYMTFIAAILTYAIYSSLFKLLN